MRVLHLTSHLNIGGVARYVLALSRGLQQRGHAVAIASGGGELEALASADRIPHWTVPLHTSAEFSLPVIAATRALSLRLRREPVDVLHAHTRVGQVVADRLSRRCRIPYVATWHGFFRPNLGRRLWPCVGDRTIAISAPVRRHLIDVFGVPEARIRLIHNGVDADYFAAVPGAAELEAYRARWRLPAGHPTIGSVGRFASGRVKGFDLLLEAAARLSGAFPDLRVVLVGDGPRRSFLEAKARSLGIADRVRFVGAATDTRLPMAVMDVFVFSSRWQEGFGLALIEAMAARKAVVAAPVGAVPEIVEHGRSGWLAAPEDAGALSDGIAGLLRDAGAVSRLGDAAQARIRQRFTLEQMVQAVERVYHELAPRA